MEFPSLYEDVCIPDDVSLPHLLMSRASAHGDRMYIIDPHGRGCGEDGDRGHGEGPAALGRVAGSVGSEPYR